MHSSFLAALRLSRAVARPHEQPFASCARYEALPHHMPCFFEHFLQHLNFEALMLLMQLQLMLSR